MNVFRKIDRFLKFLNFLKFVNILWIHELFKNKKGASFILRGAVVFFFFQRRERKGQEASVGNQRDEAWLFGPLPIA